mgnify:CR=1 FL=1
MAGAINGGDTREIDMDRPEFTLSSLPHIVERQDGSLLAVMPCREGNVRLTVPADKAEQFLRVLSQAVKDWSAEAE